MKKLVAGLLIVLCLINLSASAFAESYEGQTAWTVTYTTDGQLVISGGAAPDSDGSLHQKYENSYTNGITLNDLIMGDDKNGIEPGDSFTLYITLNHQNGRSADWYMSNSVLNTLETIKESKASGGAYTYKLTYTDPSNKAQELYSSDTVGGEEKNVAGEGLYEATSALKDYFYLDTLASGQTAKIELYVAIDGECEGNRYQDTLADLRMNFAVQQHDRKAVRTGDDTNLTPLYYVAFLSGLGVLGLGVWDLRARKQGKHSGKEKRRSAT